LRIAVIGCGYWGKNLVRTFSQLGVLHTVCDADELKLHQIARDYPNVKATRRYTTILQDKDIDGVVIASPSQQHYIMAKQAIDAGKDVLVEKPFTLDVGEARELVELSGSRNRVVLVGHLMVYHPAIRQMKNLIQSGELGKIYYLYSTRVNLGQVRCGEDVLWRLAPHDLSMFIYLLDAVPEVISAQGFSYIQSGLHDVVFAVFRVGDTVAHIQVSWLDPHKIRQLTVVGSKKMAVFDDTELINKLKIYDKSINKEDLTAQSGVVATPELDTTSVLEIECREFIDCIRTRRQPLSDAKQGLDVVTMLESVSGLLYGGSK